MLGFSRSLVPNLVVTEAGDSYVGVTFPSSIGSISPLSTKERSIQLGFHQPQSLSGVTVPFFFLNNKQPSSFRYKYIKHF